MWNKTRVTELLKIKYPIIQGPFGGKFSSSKLVATVSNLGGMGSFGLNSYSPEEILEIDKEINWSKELFKKNQLWPVINVTNKAIEETLSEILRHMELRSKTYF